MAGKTSRDSEESLEIEKVDSVDDFGPAGAGENIIEIDHGFASDLDKWITLNNTENLSPEVFLYKLPPQGNKPRSLISKFDSRIPDDHEIGMTFGSGRFQMIVHIPQGEKQKHRASMRAITIDPYYDKLRREEAAKNSTLPTQNTPLTTHPVPQSGMNDMLALMKEVMAMLSPLLMANNRQSDPGVAMIQSYAAMNRVLAAQAAENAGLMTDLQRKMLQLPEPKGETEGEETMEPEKEQSFMDKIIGLFSSPAVAAIIGSLTKSNPQAQLAGQAVRAIPEVKRILVDPAQLKATVNYLDAQLGIEKASTVLRNLKVQRPVGTGMKVERIGPRPQPKPPIRKKKVHPNNNQMVNRATHNEKEAIFARNQGQPGVVSSPTGNERGKAGA